MTTIDGQLIDPETTYSDKGSAVRAFLVGWTGDTWCIRADNHGLVVILKTRPEQPFNRVKITGHAKNGKCVFGKALDSQLDTNSFGG